MIGAPSRDISPPTWREGASAAVLIFGAAFLLFANTFGHGWTYDDFPVIVENPDVRSLAGFLRDSYPGRPLREASYLLDHALFGLNPAGWHVQNILWHAAAAFLLFLLARRLKASVVTAGVAAALFLVHPVQVEVVANLSHRKDSLVLVFLLLAVHAWLKALAPGAKRGWWVAAAALAWGISLTAKQNAVVLPLVLLVVEWVGVPAPRRLLLRPWIALAPPLLIVAVVAGWVLQGGSSSFAPMAEALLLKNQMAGGVDDYWRTVLASWAFQGWHLLWPQGLAVEYLVPVPAWWLSPRVLLPLALALLFVPALLFLRRRSPLAAFALAWTGIFWLPVSNLWPASYFAADRYLYAPSVGVFLLAALAAGNALRRAPKGAIGASVVVVVFLGVLTWRQSATWASEETLWRQALAVSPRSAFVMNEIGKLREGQGRPAEAVDLYRRATAADPRSAAAHHNLARLYEGAGLLPPAREHYGLFLSLDRPAYREAAAELRERLQRQYGWSYR